MATHILTVTKRTFKIHLNYMFIGTGKNNSPHQPSALADILGVRDNDNIIFYVMNVGFFGIFKAIGGVFYEYDATNQQYLGIEIGDKTLTYRVKIKPHEVYETPISEWDMMENPDNVEQQSIFNMQWSWIFKKLNASRGCLAIDSHEFQLLKKMFSRKNNKLPNINNYDYINGKIIKLDNSLSYDNSKTNIQPRSNSRIFKIKKEEDLRILFTAKSGSNLILNKVLNPSENGLVNFISNEVLCSFSERKMDLLLGTDKEKCLLIELKNEFVYNKNIYNQIKEYARWVSSYKLFYKEIIPVLILKEAKIMAKRKGAKYFKYLSEENKENDNQSDWYKNILQELSNAKLSLSNENIKRLQPLQVYIFTTQDNKLESFRREV
ncbi:hypothetical protein SPONL_1532 [uncultured Candidatus Thioglobus sp.]|nr:hypothetical protein SPONL_1532 [uncultured Candidatus Thioglobus sp.]